MASDWGCPSRAWSRRSNPPASSRSVVQLLSEYSTIMIMRKNAEFFLIWLGLAPLVEPARSRRAFPASRLFEGIWWRTPRPAMPGQTLRSPAWRRTPARASSRTSRGTSCSSPGRAREVSQPSPRALGVSLRSLRTQSPSSSHARSCSAWRTLARRRPNSGMRSPPRHSPVHTFAPGQLASRATFNKLPVRRESAHSTRPPGVAPRRRSPTMLGFIQWDARSSFNHG